MAPILLFLVFSLKKTPIFKIASQSLALPRGHFMRGHWLNASMPKCCWEILIFDPQFFSFTTFFGVLFQLRQNSDKNSDKIQTKFRQNFRQYSDKNSDNIQTKFRQKSDKSRQNSDKIQTCLNSQNLIKIGKHRKFRQLNSDKNSDKIQTEIQKNSYKIQTTKFR